MKNILYLLFMMIGVTLFWSCSEDDRVLPVVTVQQEPVLSLLNNVDVNITEANQSQDLVPLSWEPANFDMSVQIQYNIEADLLGNNFANPTILTSTADTQTSISGEALNNLLWDNGVFPGIEAPIELRVVAVLQDAEAEAANSNVVQLNVTGFAVEEFEDGLLFIATQFPDYTWNFMEAPTICSAEDNGNYMGFLFLDAANDHYFVPSSEEFTYYGAGAVAGVLEVEGDAIQPEESGYAMLSVNTNTNTYSVGPAEWGIIGSSTPNGWDADTDMTFDESTGYWSITATMIPGEYKFRANDDWALNMGMGPNEGTLAQDGPNFAFAGEEGTYTVTMNLSGCCFTYWIEDANGDAVIEPGSCEEEEEPTGNEYTFLYFVGDATAQGWDNNSIYPIFNDVDNTDLYHYTGYFAAGGFKLLEVPGSWDFQYGLGESEGLLSTDGGSGNIPITTAGYYTFTMNKAELTYTLETYDATSDDTYTTLGLIGPSSPQGNWDADMDLTQSSFDDHIWYMQDGTLTADEEIGADPGMKVRAEDAWDNNWGGDTFPVGVGNPGGANIAVSESGTYDIWFNDITKRYVAIKQD